MKFIIILLASISSTLSFADCDFKTQINDIHINWNGHSQEIQQSIKSSRGKTRDFNCKFYFYTFSKGNSGTYNRKLINNYGESIDYNLYMHSGERSPLKDFNDLHITDQYIRGLLLFPYKEREDKFYFSLRQPSRGTTPLVRGGIYRDTISIGVYSSFLFRSPRLEGTRTLNISTVIPKQVNISLVDTGAPFNINDTEQTLDFGELEKGEQLGFDMRIQSNAGYVVTFSSQNKGRLKHSTKKKKIRYKLKVDGRKRNLKKAGSTRVARARGVTPAGGNIHKVSVRIGKVKNKPHGVYSDYITVTAMTIE